MSSSIPHQALPGVSGDTPVAVFRRGDVGAEETPLELIRCPAALLLTVDFLFQRVLDADHFGADARFGSGRAATAPTLFDIHSFLLDRTRAVRKECTLQNFVGKERNSAVVMEVRGSPSLQGAGEGAG